MVVGRASKAVNESRIHVEDLSAERGFFLQDALGQSTPDIQGELFHSVIIFKAASLPSGCRSAFDYEQRSAPGMLCDSVEQRSQDFFLGAARLNRGHAAQQVRRASGRAIVPACLGGALW